MTTNTGWKRDAIITAATLGLILLSLANGFSPVLTALAAIAAPLAGYCLAGRLPGRGGAAACVALALAATLIRPSSSGGAMPIADIMLLGVMAVAATTAARFADRMMLARQQSMPVAVAADGRWMTVVVECDEGPAGLAVNIVRPKDSPRNDPEQRRVIRVANDRVAGRRSIPRPKLQSSRS